MQGDLAHSTAYHGYLLLIAGLDAEWSRHNRCDPSVNWFESFENVIRDLDGYCAAQRSLLEEIFRDLCDVDPAARGKYEKPDGNGARRAKQFPAHLFRPVTVVPFGHADVISLFLADDFDVVNEFAASFSGTIEEVAVGCCPVMGEGGLGLSGRWFVEPSDFIERMSGNAEDGAGGGSPLLGFTRIKLDGLGMLADGLLFQEACFRAIGEKISKVVEGLADQFSDDEIGSLVCCFVDLFGQEEVGLLIGSSNYSLSVALSVAVSGLTYQEILASSGFGDEGERLEALLGRRDSFRAVLAEGEGAGTLKANHVFRWTESILGIHSAAFRNYGEASVGGEVMALTRVQLAAGHQLDFERDVTFAAEGGDDSKRWVGIGSYDVVFGRGSVGTGGDGTRRPTAKVIEALHEILDNCGGVRELTSDDGSRQGAARHVTEMATLVAVPVPNHGEIFRNVGDGHATVLSDALAGLRRQIGGQISPVFGRAPDGGEAAREIPMSLALLRQSMRETGFPVATRRSIEFLFQNFISVSTNPFLFDAVVDLYDPFLTLYETICRHLPAAGILEPKYEGRRMLVESQIEGLSNYVQALHRAMEQRLFRAFPQSSMRQMSVDFRCGFSQLLFASMTPVTCVVGLWRRFVAAQESGVHDRSDDDVSFGKVGLFPSIGFHPSIHGEFLGLGCEDEARLGYIETDVPHLFHVPALSDFIHESFHFVYEWTVETQPALGLGRHRDPSRVKKGDEDDLEEAFVHALFLQMVCGGDEEVFLTHALTAFSTSVRRAADDLTGAVSDWRGDAILQFVTIFNRLSLAAWMVRASNGEKASNRRETLGNRDGAKAAFSQQLAKYGRLVRHYREMGEHCADLEDWQDGIETHAVDLFDELYVRLWNKKQARLLGLVDRIRQFNQFYRDSLRRYFESEPARRLSEPQLKTIEGELETGLGSAFSEGRPISSGRFEIARGFTETLDPLMVLFAVFKEYLGQARDLLAPGEDDRVRECHLPRRSGSGRQFEASDDGGVHTQYCDFLIHSGSVSRFCCIPDMREARLKRQVAALKTLWDLSTKLKGRRLKSFMGLPERERQRHAAAAGEATETPGVGNVAAVISYNTKDEGVVRPVAQKLSPAGGEAKLVWLDDQELLGGEVWHAEFRASMQVARLGFFWIGKHGIGESQAKELVWMLDWERAVGKQRFLVVPVLITEGSDTEPPEVPAELQERVRISYEQDSKGAFDYEAIKRFRRRIDEER